MLEVDPGERVREAVRVALAADLAVGDQIDSGPFHVVHGQDGRIVLSLFEMLRRDPPELAGERARRQAFGETLAVDQPVRLRIAPDDRRGETPVRGQATWCGVMSSASASNATARRSFWRPTTNHTPWTGLVPTVRRQCGTVESKQIESPGPSS